MLKSRDDELIIIRRFARLHPRRLELTNILSERPRNQGEGT